MRRFVILTTFFVSISVCADEITNVVVPVDEIREIHESEILSKATIVDVYDYQPIELYSMVSSQMTMAVWNRVKNEDRNHSFYNNNTHSVISWNGEDYLQYTPSDTIYKITGEAFEPYIRFDFGKYSFKDDLCNVSTLLYDKYLKSHSNYAGYIEKVLQIDKNLIAFTYHYQNHLVTAFYNLQTGKILNGLYKSDVFNTDGYLPAKHISQDGVLIFEITDINPYTANAAKLFSQEDLQKLKSFHAKGNGVTLLIKFEYKNL